MAEGQHPECIGAGILAIYMGANYAHIAGATCQFHRETLQNIPRSFAGYTTLGSRSMRTLDLQAEIIPGRSAAGFEIGMDVAEIAAIVNHATILDQEVTVASLRQNRGVIVKRDHDGGIRSVYFGDDQVRLSFNAAGNLFCIFLFEGYTGLYLEAISVGSPMSYVQRLHTLLYDDGDEMCYIADVEENIVPGIAFAGSACSLDDDPEQLVCGFCVHDWSIQN